MKTNCKKTTEETTIKPTLLKQKSEKNIFANKKKYRINKLHFKWLIMRRNLND